MIRPAIDAPVHDLASAKAWIDGMIAAGLAFDMDMDPRKLVHVRTGEPMFTAAECDLLDSKVEMVGWAFAQADESAAWYQIEALEAVQ